MGKDQNERPEDVMTPRALKLLRVTMLLDEVDAKGNPEGIRIRDLRIQLPGETGGDYRVIIRGRTAEGPLVAFHSGNTPEGCIEGALRKIVTGGHRWREDAYQLERDEAAT